METKNIDNKQYLQGLANDLIANALKEAEMRQSCTDYGYYAEILLRQLEPIIFKYALKEQS